MSNKLAFTPELGATLISENVTDAESAAFIANPADFLKSNYDIDTSVEVKVLENNPDTINLALPYYSVLESASTTAITDSELDSVAGGEVVFSLCVLAGAAAFGGLATGAIAGENARYGRHIDGSHK